MCQKKKREDVVLEALEEETDQEPIVSKEELF